MLGSMRALVWLAALPACIFTVPPPAQQGDDAPGAVSVGFDQAAQTVGEGITVPVAISLSASTATTVTVMLGIGNGTATAGTDFDASGATLTFDPGETSRSIDVMIA